MWRHCSACRVSCSKAMKVRHLISVDDAQCGAKDACVMHLSIHVGIDPCKTGAAFEPNLGAAVAGSVIQESTSKHRQNALMSVRLALNFITSFPYWASDEWASDEWASDEQRPYLLFAVTRTCTHAHAHGGPRRSGFGAMHGRRRCIAPLS